MSKNQQEIQNEIEALFRNATKAGEKEHKSPAEETMLLRSLIASSMILLRRALLNLDSIDDSLKTIALEMQKSRPLGTTSTATTTADEQAAIRRS